MSGRGGVYNVTWDGYIPPQSQPNPSILRLTADLKWVEAMEPLHIDIDLNKTIGIGPGMPFASTVLAKNPSFGTIGLVPCAIGGSSITEWARGGLLYNQMLKRTAAALVGGGSLRGLLWYQGEADTITLKDAQHYRSRFERFLSDVRADLGFPELLVIEVALATGQGPYLEEVRKAQFDTNVTNIKCVDAKGLQVSKDYLHLTTQAQVQLGGMLADVFLHTLQPPIPSNSL